MRCYNLDVLLPPFNERYAASLHVTLAGERDASLPERFTDASSFRHKAGHRSLRSFTRPAVFPWPTSYGYCTGAHRTASSIKK